MSDYSQIAKAIQRQRDAFERTRPLCPDHRDKVKGEDCLMCQIERLQAAIDRDKIPLAYLALNDAYKAATSNDECARILRLFVCDFDTFRKEYMYKSWPS